MTFGSAGGLPAGGGGGVGGTCVGAVAAGILFFSVGTGGAFGFSPPGRMGGVASFLMSANVL